MSDVPPGAPSNDDTPQNAPTEAAPETMAAASRAEEATRAELDDDSSRAVDQDTETAPEE